MHRRHFLQNGSVLAASAVIPHLQGQTAPANGTNPKVEAEIKTISMQPQFYHGWPTVTRLNNGDLWVAWSGGREGHVCPFGQACAMVSHDEGKNWTWPRVILDSAIDDRDCGIMETAQGSLLLSTFSSLAYQPVLEKALKEKNWPEERLQRWMAMHQRLSPAAREAEPGHTVLRSTDGGKSWSKPIPTLVNSPHGPIQLKSGRLLYAGKQLWTSKKLIGVAVSDDDGLSWQMLSAIPARRGDMVTSGYHELHAVEAADGAIIVQIRNHNRRHANETLQTESADGGRTWSKPHPIGVWGLPSHLLRLKDDRLLMTYGYRRKPFGNQARISTDHGKTWGAPITISADGTSGDLGYPSTVELGNGSLLTVWYEKMDGQENAVLRQAKWGVK